MPDVELDSELLAEFKFASFCSMIEAIMEANC